MKTTKELKQEQYDLKAKLHEVIEFTNSDGYFKLSAREKGLNQSAEDRDGTLSWVSDKEVIWGCSCSRYKHLADNGNAVEFI